MLAGWLDRNGRELTAAPPVGRGMIDFDPALDRQLLDVSIGQSSPEIPADRQHDDVRLEPIAGERRNYEVAGPGSADESSRHRRPTSSRPLNATAPCGFVVWMTGLLFLFLLL